MSLEEYLKKRKFRGKEKTTEPKGKKENSKNKKNKIFVIHKHHASHLHWDLRLEMDGVLKSWAVPKEPPKIKGIKRLAIQVEDHPLDYANFKGKIPEGNYGAGKVEIWDKGNYILLKNDKGKIEFELKGKKLKGKFILLKTKYMNKTKNNWLFFKI
jgi:DNA ligase D-like protein (predicted 3'-phosphoesterase)